MNHVKIKDKIYEYIVDFKDNEEIRNSFNNLTGKTYGFDFEEWYQNGYWKDRYIPYVLLDGKKVISNVSVNVIDFFVMGEKKKYVQIGTVMTDEDYRNQGLNRFIMKKVLDEWKDKCDLIYLFANDTVLNFYPKFGFVSTVEYQHSKEISVENPISNIKKLNMLNQEHRKFLFSTINDSLPVSKFSMCDNTSLIMFYCISFMKHNVYHIETLNTIVIADFDDNVLYLNGVFCPKDIQLDDIIAEVANKSIKKIVFGFTPKDVSSYDATLLKEDDTTLFVIEGKEDIFRDNKIMFPVLSHA